MANAIGRSDLTKDASEPLRLDPYESAQTIMTGPRALDLNLRLVLPKGMEIAKPDPYVMLSQIRLGPPAVLRIPKPPGFPLRIRRRSSG